VCVSEHCVVVCVTFWVIGVVHLEVLVGWSICCPTGVCKVGCAEGASLVGGTHSMV
jgi:hypothetical protein